MRWLSWLRDPGIWSRDIKIDWEPLRRLVRERPEMLLSGLGIALRILQYSTNRAIWLDEMALKANLAGKPILDFSEALSHDQLAPFGFLIIERAIARVLGDSDMVLRLVPLAAGILGVILFLELCRRLLSRRAALVAMVMFATSDDLIYYSTELKPYSVDLAFGLAIMLASFDVLGKPARARSAGLLVLLAALAPWCSFASAFVVAGCGTVLLLDSLLAGRYRDALLWACVGLGWLANFVVACQASQALLSPYTTMYLFWDFAFIPIHLRDSGDLAKAGGILLEIFVNPLNLVVPAWPRASVILPLVLMAAGLYSTARRSFAIHGLLSLPIALAIAASCARRYPFHGRLILELVPALFLLIAEGTDWLYRRDMTRSRMVYKTILVALLAYPCLSALYHAPWPQLRNFNRHGDLRRNVFIE
jgi:hypothetical protein